MREIRTMMAVKVKNVLEYRKDYKIIFRHIGFGTEFFLRLPKYYFQYEKLKVGEVYNFNNNGTFRGIDYEVVYDYQLVNDDKNFNLFYDMPLFIRERRKS